MHNIREDTFRKFIIVIAIIVLISIRTVWLMIGHPLAFMRDIIYVYYWVLFKKRKLLKGVLCVVMLIFAGILGLLLKLDLFPRRGLKPSVDVILGLVFPTSSGWC